MSSDIEIPNRKVLLRDQGIIPGC